VHESPAVSYWRPARADRTVAVVPGTMATRPHEGQHRQASDEEAWLARRAAAGDGSAFTTLYDRYERRAYNLCYRITGSRDDAADATQETFVNVLERLPHLTGRELQFGPYLLRAARHASCDAIARRRRAAPAAEIPESAAARAASGQHAGTRRRERGLARTAPFRLRRLPTARGGHG
jgi:RNA polymerase sigma-70 factor (ECF subfamily)